MKIKKQRTLKEKKYKKWHSHSKPLYRPQEFGKKQLITVFFKNRLTIPACALQNEGSSLFPDLMCGFRNFKLCGESLHL